MQTATLPESIQVGKLKAEFSSVLEQVKQGKEFIIEYGRNHKQVAKIVPIEVEKPKERKFGQLKGKIWVADDFDDENEEINDMFYNSDLNL
jgi:antitoxin (DNA-binding transcriptional repressor) of toxin-antitoxin stability system